MSYEITFGGRFQAGLGITAGKVVVKAGNLYLPATTANVALYPIAGLVVRYQQVPSANYDVGDIAHAGVWPSSLTGLSAATAGVATYARVTSTGSLESTTAPADGDQLMGRINSDGDIILVHEVYSVIPANTVQTIVNIMDYGAVCDGVTDDSDAWDAVMADVPILGIDVIEVPKTAGGCAISRPIRMCSTDGAYLMNGVTIRGQLSTPAVAPALTYLVWLQNKRTGTAASLVSTANDVEPGPDYLGVTWTHVLLSNCTGANFTPDDVGTLKVRIEDASNPLLNAQMCVTKYVSPTSVYLGAQNGGAFGSDANNGAIKWTVLESMIYMQGRALAVENLSPFIASGKYAYNFLSFTHPTGGSNQLSVTGCTAKRISVQPAGTGVCENLLEVGQWIVPTTTQVGWEFTFQTAVNGQYRPWSPYQCDYFELENAIIINDGAAYEGACIRSANSSGQSRANIARDIGSIAKQYITLERSDFPNANGGASSSWTIHHATGGGITVACVGRTSGQAQFTVNQLSCEQGAAIFKSYGYANAITSTVFNGAYYFSVNSGLYAYDPAGIFQVTDGSYLSVNDCELELSGLNVPGGYFVDAVNTGRATITFTNCNLPDPAGYGRKSLREIFNLRGLYAKVNLTNCTTYKYGVGLSALGNVSYVGGAYVAGANIHAADRFGDSLLMRGTSNSLFTASNYFGVVTISGATETRKTWEFVDPEIDEDYEGHYYEILPTLLYSSGTVAAAAIPVDIQKARRSCTLELGAPPGAGASVTYGLRLIRHNKLPTTAFHPQDIPDLYFYFDAEYDVGYNVAISPELQDNITGRLYWRNQASRRGLAYTNISACDAFACTTGSVDDPTALFDVATDAAFNDRYVATTTTSKRMLGLMHGTEACASPFTMFVVGTAGTGAGDKCPFQLWDGATAKTAEFLNNGTTTYLYIDGVTTLNTAHTWTTPEVVCGVANGASSALYISSITATATGTAGTMTTGADDYFLIGANNAYSRYWSGTGGGAVGKIAAILVYKGALSTADRTSVTNWLGTRYGITIAP